VVAYLIKPVSTIVVPTSSVVPGSGGQLCIWIAAKPDIYEALDVEVLDSAAGSADIRADMDAGELVLVNPIEVLERPECP
jgi:hypothetical protein